MNDQPIKPPAKDHPDDKVRALLEAGIETLPFGGSVTRVVEELLPTRAQKERESWEKAISERVNLHSNRFQELLSLTGTTSLNTQTKNECARDLAFLAFWNDGMRGPLERIAFADGTQAELEQISSLLRGLRS
jgi:hypothetical protein